MSSFVIDSSVYIALFNTKDVWHAKTREFFTVLYTIFPDAEFYLPSLVLFEISHVIFRFKKPEIVKKYAEFEQELFHDPRFTIYSLDFDFLAAFQNALKKETMDLKAADAIIGFTAQINNSVLISWDKKLLQKAPQPLRRYTPIEFMKQKAIH